jgi:hypothetical protein
MLARYLIVLLIDESWLRNLKLSRMSSTFGEKPSR